MPSKEELEAADTQAPDATAPPSVASAGDGLSPAASADALGLGVAVANWDRYELLGLLGKGGMGVVYEARDRRLGRPVALKFILGAHPNLVMRFLQEARAQARIDHPNICRVYEVGDVDGRAYIAMQLSQGVQLGRVAGELRLDDKVAILRDVAVAIHEAHRLGIIHRDLKPSNILVERAEDGRWFPLVLDFGLARESAGEVGLTESGALLGTPAYMAPEQARGDPRAVDRRSDVYSLGATFYELLTGRPPYAHTSLALALDQLLHGEPPTPRSLAPHLPVDLETIALKCLAREPERRYPSARALADDLSRYLDGEPILGRRPSLWQRLRLRARRNRALVTMTASSLLVVLVLAGLGARAWLTSRRERARAAAQAQLAAALGQDAEEIEWLLRAAYQLPVHDTTPERDIIRARMRRIAATRHDLGRVGDATIHAALGRGHLMLHEWPEAEGELARAVAAGLDTPGLHAARGQALGELYHRALEKARRAGDKAWLAQREKELARRYLEPALAELARSRGDGDTGAGSTATLEALVALYRRDYARAEERALFAVARAPWRFEARKIAADAAYAAAVAEVDRGSYDGARPGLEHATALYAAAADVARSDASVHEAAAQAWLERAEVDFRQDQAPRAALEQALDAVDKALRADPKDARGYTTRAYVLLRWYRTPSLRGPGSQRPFLERLAATAERAVAVDAADANAWDALGNAHVYRGLYEMVQGGSGEPWWQRAQAEIGRALALDPDDPWAHNDLGVVHRWLGTRLASLGRDAMPEYTAAIRSYARAAEIDPQYTYARSNQVDIEATLAWYQAAGGVDPSATVAEARRAGERGLAIDPSFSIILENMAQAQLALARFLVDAGRDPAPPLAEARALVARSLLLHAGNSTTYYLSLVAAWLEAHHRRQSGQDPAAAIAVGRAALTQALRATPDCAGCFIVAARLDLVAAAGADDPARLVAQALAHVRRAVAIDDQEGEAQVVAAAASLQLATARHGEAAARARAQGLTWADAALARNPRLAEAHAVRAALLAQSARATTR